MKSLKNSQTNLNLYQSSTKTYRQNSSHSETPRLERLEEAVTEIQQLCNWLEQEKKACNNIRNQTYKLIQIYQQCHNKIQQYVQSSTSSLSCSKETHYYIDSALDVASQYLKSKPKPVHKKIKSLQKSVERSKVLKRLDLSIRSPNSRR